MEKKIRKSCIMIILIIASKLIIILIKNILENIIKTSKMFIKFWYPSKRETKKLKNQLPNT